MMTKYSGGCLCGQARYEGEAEPLFSGFCHCVDCQKATGAGHAAAFAVPVTAFTVTGEVRQYAKGADSGNTITRHFCPSCGSILFTTSTKRPGVMMLTAGTLDHPDLFQPTFAIYTSRAQRWDQPHADVDLYPEMPPSSAE